MKFYFNIYAFFISIGFTTVLIPIILLISHKKRWYDFSDKRKIHDGNIPRIGGVGIFCGFMLGAFFALFIGRFFEIEKVYFFKLILFFASCTLIHIIGLLDDFNNLRARYKLFSQVLIAFIMVGFGFHFKEVNIIFTGIVIQNKIICQMISMVWIVGISNAINLIDGIDGLSSTITFVAALMFALMNLMNGDFVTGLLYFALMGSVGGFFIYNKPKASIFMGDSGSLLIGFILAVLPMLQILPTETMVLETSITVLLVPITDTLFAMTRRTLAGKKFSCPDKEHIHHILLDLENSNWKIIIGLGLLTIIYSTYPMSLAARHGEAFTFEAIGMNIVWIISGTFMYFLHKKWKRKFR